MVQKIRYTIIHFLINRELRRQHREKKAVGLQHSRTVGIVFALDQEKHYRRINTLINQLAGQNKEVGALAYCNEKELPNYFMSSLKIDVLTKKQQGFFGIPKKTGPLAAFLEKPFDVLIDLTPIQQLGAKYLVASSAAKFKTGLYCEELVKVYDFMMKMPEGASFDDYCDTLLKYLSSLNSTKS